MPPPTESRSPLQLGSAAATALSILLLTAHVGLWFFFPSGQVHPDALDELHRFDIGAALRTPWHPLGGPLVQAWVRLWNVLPEPGTVLRSVQVWNGAWMTVALLGIGRFGALRSSPGFGLAMGLFIACGYAGLHLSLDPYLPDWPPALAASAWALVVAHSIPKSSPHSRLARLVVGSALLSLAASFVPLFLVIGPLSLLLATEADRPGRARAALAFVAAPALFLLIAMVAAGVPPETGRPHPDFAGLGLFAAASGLAGALLPAERRFSPLAVLHHPESPLAWASAVSLLLGGFVVVSPTR